MYRAPNHQVKGSATSISTLPMTTSGTPRERFSHRSVSYTHLHLFTAAQAASIGIIGGADGPTAIFVTNKLAPEPVSYTHLDVYKRQ